MPDAIAPTSTDYFAAQASQRAAAQAAAASAASGKSFADGDMFLKLLVTQMRFQNPLDPVKGNEFIAQSAQLATVESLQAMQKSQASSDLWSRMGAAQQMLGTQVVATAADGGEVTGIATAVTATSEGPRLTLTTPTGTVLVDLDAVRSAALPGAPATAHAAAPAPTR